jgi:hypothetical protein
MKKLFAVFARVAFALVWAFCLPKNLAHLALLATTCPKRSSNCPAKTRVTLGFLHCYSQLIIYLAYKTQHHHIWG